MLWLLLGILIVPAIEIGVFIWVGSYIGPLWVILLIVITGMAGIMLARYEGMRTIQKAQISAANGQMPGPQLIEGICILLGGILLFAPGFVTDAIGLFLIIPFTRKLAYGFIFEFLRKRMNKGTFFFRRF